MHTNLVAVECRERTWKIEKFSNELKMLCSTKEGPG